MKLLKIFFLDGEDEPLKPGEKNWLTYFTMKWLTMKKLKRWFNLFLPQKRK